MSVVGIVARIVVGLAFAAAGLFKLLDGPAWPRQAADMGVARPIALAVPYVELGVGAVLALQLFEPLAAIVAVALILAFTVLIVLRLRDGSRPPCACFGSRSNRPLGASHIIRNLALLALAGLAVVA